MDTKRGHDVVRYVVFTLHGKGSATPHYVPVGKAFHNRDGTLTVYLDSLPVDGELLLRPEAPRPSAPRSPP